MATMILHQGDDEVVAIGPILDPDGSYYTPAVGDTTTLVIKSSQHVADADGTTYAGTLVEDAVSAGQWFATFTIPKADLPTLGRRFFLCRVINAAGQQQTLVGGDVDVDPGRQAQRASTTTAPVLNLAGGGGAHPDLAAHDALGLATQAELNAHAVTAHAGDHPDGDHAGLAPLASPTFTGTPAAPTAAQGTNTTQVATTAFVMTEAGLLVPKGLVDAKGDLLVGTADNTIGRRSVGADGTVLTADSAEATGVKWATPAGSSAAPPRVYATINPMSQNAAGSMVAANELYTYQVDPLTGPITVTKVCVAIGTSTGNIDVAVFSLSGTTLTRLASSGVIACPAGGFAEVTLTAGVLLTPGTVYYLGLAASATAATFFTGPYSSNFQASPVLGAPLYRHHTRGSLAIPATVSVTTNTVAGDRGFVLTAK